MGSLYFLIRGKVDVTVNNEFVISFKGIGHIFGEMSFVANALSSAAVAANSDIVMMAIDFDKVNELNEPIHYRMRMNLYKSCAEILTKKLVSTNAIAQSYLRQVD